MSASSGWLWSVAGAWGLDGLSAVFLVLILAVGAAATVHSRGYLAQPRYGGESRWRYWPFLALFLAGMIGVVAARDLVLFIVCWEVMTLASYVLVAFEAGEPGVLRAAFKYFVMTHVGTACLLLAFVWLGALGGSFSFAALPITLGWLAAARPAALHAVLALCFVGFATKAGLWPFGDWLPDAHPAAPAPVSALLSGVMVKLGLYGFLRFFVWTLAAADPAAAAVWGHVLLLFGVVSAVLGGMAAAAAQDAKVLLAYSSVAQSGLIAVGVGAALALAPAHPALAALALIAAAFHLVGDAFVKALLFLTVGALQLRAGSRRLEDLGGFFQAMPVTAWTALVGSLAIAGFPPLTAFVSKWMLLQSTVLSGAPLIAVAGLGVLAASLFSILYALKFFGAAFLGRMRSGNLEAPPSMRHAQIALAACVLLLSAAPGPWLRLLVRAFGACPLVDVARDAGAWGAGALGPATGAFAPLLLVVAAGWVAALALLALGTGAAARRAPGWLGGLPAAESGAAARPHPLGLYSTLRPDLARAYPRLRAPLVPRRLRAAGAALPGLLDLDRWLYRPAAAGGRSVSRALRRAHTGMPHLYIVWQLLGALALVLLLLARRRWLTP
jgi:hydrogenase-4 component B